MKRPCCHISCISPLASCFAKFEIGGTLIPDFEKRAIKLKFAGKTADMIGIITHISTN